MSKQVVFGAFGGVNIGDEAIFLSVSKLLKKLGSGVDVVIGTGCSDEAVFSGLYKAEKTKFIPASNVLASLKSCVGSDLVIGGGQLIDGSAGFKLALYQLVLALIIKLTGGSVKLASVGVFCMNSRVTRAIYSILFLLSDRITVRDKASLERISFSVFARRKAKIVPDVVFSLFPLAGVEAVSPRKRIVLSVHHAPHVSFVDMELAINFTKQLLESTKGKDFDVVLTAHDRREKFDLKFANDILSRVSDPRLSLVTFDSVDECLKFYSESMAVISARMHPLIIGAVAGCHVVPLVGSSKVSEFSRLVGVGIWEIEALLALGEAELLKVIGIFSGVAKPDEFLLAQLSDSAKLTLG